jgi:predicted regulator of Ras-like GTPase activity (Roadblock/LC7/MglB family)
MIAFLKAIFRGRAAPQSAGGLAIPRTVYTPGNRPVPTPRRAPTPRATPKPAPAPAPESISPAATEPDSNGAVGSDVDISLQSVLKGLPNDLKDRVRDLDIRGATMTISLERILAQLPSGSVKISFGSLRHAAPQLFSAGADCDSRDVALPLDEILAKINPAMICPPQDPPARGPIEAGRGIPSDTDTFVPRQPAVEATPSRGSTLAVPSPSAPGEAADQTTPLPSTQSARNAPAPARKSPIRVPTPQMAKQVENAESVEVDLLSLIKAWPSELRKEIAQWNLADAKVTLPIKAVREELKRGRVAFPWKTLRSWITPPPPANDSVHDSATVELPLPVITPLFVTGQKQPPKSPQKTAIDEIPDLFFDGRKAEGSISNDDGGEPAVETHRGIPTAEATPVIAENRSSAPAAEVVTALQGPDKSVNDGNVMRIRLDDLVQSWPGDLRAEIGHWNLPQLMVSLPAEQINAGLKQGKIAFPWKALRSWIVPTPPSAASAHDKAILELPLPVIMPLFLAGRKPPSKPQPKIDDDIPDPFAEFLEPQPATTTAPAAAKTTAPVAAKASPSDSKSNGKLADALAVVEKLKKKSSKRKQAPETLEPSTEVESQPPVDRAPVPAKPPSTPVEVLASAVELQGVAGALVALSDGFKVASKLPPGLDGDALAAFLPHIFSKVDQSTRELRMGDLNNLNFTVDNIPWKIFHVNKIYFAALGHAGQPMPTEELAALAHKLTFKN